MKTKVAFIHTTPLVLEPVRDSVDHLSGSCRFFHMLDEAILIRMMEDGNTPELTEPWLADIVEKAVRGGASLVIVTCSSLSPSVTAVGAKFPVPVLRIDEAMYRQVLTTASNPAVLMTNPTNEVPARLMADEIRKDLALEREIPMVVCREAFRALQEGRNDLHDQEVLAQLENLCREHDAIILSQISIERVRKYLPEKIREKVYSSLDFVGKTIQDHLAG